VKNLQEAGEHNQSINQIQKALCLLKPFCRHSYHRIKWHSSVLSICLT